MIHLYLSEKSIFTWDTCNNTHVCGYGYVEDKHLQGVEFAEAVHRFLKQDASDELLDKIEGCFAFIHQSENLCIAAVDHIRSIPLFYAQKGGDLYVSDNAEWIRSSLQLNTLDKKNAAEFLVAHFVTDNETLFPKINQLRSGEVLKYASKPEPANSISTNRYFTFSRTTESDTSEDEFIERLDQVHLTVFRNLIKSLNGRQAVVPLSGGFDSRLIAVMMHRLEYENMKFISYGRLGNWEGQIAKEVADYLEVDWHFVPLDQQIWFDAFHQEERKDFTFAAGNLTSHTIIQEYPVLQILREQGIVDADAVFLPGHSGGFTSGAHIPSEILRENVVSREELHDYILKKNYKKWDWRNSNENYTGYFHDKIHRLLNVPAEMKPAVAAALYERWVWQERQAKFIVNSIRNFEHYDYEWRLPLWNKQLVNFWMTVPVDIVREQALLKKYIDDKISLPVTPPNSPRLAKIIDRYHPTAKAWIGRYIDTKNVFQAMNIKLQDVLPVNQLPYDFIPLNKRILLTGINALGSLQYLHEIIDKTGAEIR